VTGGPDWRRLLPPPRRRPGLVAVVVRWRVEVLLALGVAVLLLNGNVRVLELVAGATAVGLAATAAGRAAAVVAFQVLVVPHRVRAAFVQAGVASRQGHLPWIFYARPAGDAVLVSVGLRAGITLRDLRDAVPVVLGACGASQVEVVSRPGRPDRATILVVRPRRGLW
jgi:hypothetical protein